MPQRTCKKCKRVYTVGIDGMGNGLCDDCAGVDRDAVGYDWRKHETSQTYQDCETGEVRTVAREDAFRRVK